MLCRRNSKQLTDGLRPGNSKELTPTPRLRGKFKQGPSLLENAEGHASMPMRLDLHPTWDVPAWASLLTSSNASPNLTAARSARLLPYTCPDSKWLLHHSPSRWRTLGREQSLDTHRKGLQFSLYIRRCTRGSRVNRPTFDRPRCWIFIVLANSRPRPAFCLREISASLVAVHVLFVS